MNSLVVETIRVLSDNYAYLLLDLSSKLFCLVDPAGEPAFLAAKDKIDRGFKIDSILSTHKHEDHCGYNHMFAREFPLLRFLGSEIDKPSSTNVFLNDGDTWKLGKNINFTAMHAPCHTRGHMMYYVEERDESGSRIGLPMLFTGDTIFKAGCGRFFEGTASDMDSIVKRVLKDVPDDCLMFCGHEYTMSNLKFATSIEPDNEDIKNEIKVVGERLKSGEPSVPSSLSIEKLTNPFFRYHLPCMLHRFGTADPVKSLEMMRKAKDSFKVLD